MISITERSQAALTAMAELALAGAEVQPIPELARRSGVTVALLEQLLPALRRAGLVESRRGVKGGYRVAGEPDSINALQVVEAVDGELSLPGDQLPPWESVVVVLRDKLQQLDLATLAAERSQAAGGPMYYI